MDNDTGSLINFNEIQQNLADTLNPQTAKERTKEIIANLLLGMGAPYFLERLKEKLPADVIDKITELLKDPSNLGKNSLEFAKQIFKDKFLEPVKNQLLDKLATEIPELKGIDLTKASLGDIQKTVAKGVLDRMKAKLPPEIAENLPESFSQEDILNAVKRVGADKALEFAKNNLPPEAYAELERNQDILQNPERISDFVKGKLDDLQGQVENNFNNVKAQVQGRLDEVKQAIKGKIDEATTEARGKIDQIKQAQTDARKAWNDTKSEFNDRYKSAQKKLNDFQSENPNASADDLKPFQDEVKNIADRANAAKESFFNGQDDLSSQLEDAQGEIDKITQSLVEKVGNIRATVSGKLGEAQAQGERAVAETRAGQQAVQQAVQPEAEARIANIFQASEGGEESASLFDRASSFIGQKVSEAKQFFGKFSQSQPTLDSTGNIQFGEKAIMLQADEPETAFTENALRAVARNPVLSSYYGTENTPADQLLDNTSKTVFRPYKPTEKRLKAPKQEPTEEPPSTVEEPLLSPQGADQLLPMREMMARQQQEQMVPDEEEAPRATTTAEQPKVPPQEELAEQPKAPVEDIGEGEDIGEQTAKVIGKEGGDEVGDIIGGTIAATQEIPVLDVLVDLGGLLGSIFGAKALMGGKTPPQPIVSGSAYEPNL